MNNEMSESMIFKLFQVENINGIRVYESYCESWADIINSIIISFLQVDNKTQFTKQFYLLLKQEIQFATFQLIKILNNYDLTYKTLVDNSYKVIKFKEHTHILSYYIIKLILLFNSNKFGKWCEKYNNTILQFGKESNIVHFIELIEELYMDSAFLKYIENVENKIIQNTFDDNLNYTMRMTIVEV